MTYHPESSKHPQRSGISCLSPTSRWTMWTGSDRSRWRYCQSERRVGAQTQGLDHKRSKKMSNPSISNDQDSSTFHLCAERMIHIGDPQSGSKLQNLLPNTAPPKKRWYVAPQPFQIYDEQIHIFWRRQNTLVHLDRMW